MLVAFYTQYTCKSYDLLSCAGPRVSIPAHTHFPEDILAVWYDSLCGSQQVWEMDEW